MAQTMPTLAEVDTQMAEIETLLTTGAETVRLLEEQLSATRQHVISLTAMRDALSRLERLYNDNPYTQPDPVTTQPARPMVNVKVTIPYSKYRQIIECIPVTKSSMEKHSIPESCCICLDAFKRGTKVHKTPCGHFYHAMCLREQLVKVGPPRCPMCRFDVRGE